MRATAPRHPPPPKLLAELQLFVPIVVGLGTLGLGPLRATRVIHHGEQARGRAEIVAFLKRKWAKELDYRLMKELWAFTDDRISVRFEYEWHDAAGQWFRTHGNEHWEFDDDGLMRRRDMSANDYPIAELERRWSI